MAMNPARGKQREKNYEYEARLNYIVRPSLEKQVKK
jgi:hypothetical protein